jgi:demethylmenaquinone methyltransferase/2-methoxy-6-polyprenyl-1,4-benzoquinol methylase
MFGRIAPRYDLLNRLMSLGMDRSWRRLAAAAASPSGLFALDLGTGTGDLALELCRQGAAHVVGADLSPEMLGKSRVKTASAGIAPVSWILADALRLPFPEGGFDRVTSAFLLRNLADLRLSLSEMTRVLRAGGHLISLDMTQPSPGLFGALYRLYFNHLLPSLAGAISRDPDAYRYLPASLKGFPSSSDLAALMTDVGLTHVRVRRLGGGSVALHTARKPRPPALS